MHFVGLMRRPPEQPVYARLNNDMYLRIGGLRGQSLPPPPSDRNVAPGLIDNFEFRVEALLFQEPSKTSDTKLVCAETTDGGPFLIRLPMAVTNHDAITDPVISASVVAFSKPPR